MTDDVIQAVTEALKERDDGIRARDQTIKRLLREKSELEGAVKERDDGIRARDQTIIRFMNKELADIGDVKPPVATLTNENQDLRGRIDTLTRLVEVLKRKLSESELECSQVRNVYEEMLKKEIELENRVVAQNTAFKSLQDIHRQTDKTLIALRERYRDLHYSRDKLYVEIEELREQLDDSQRRVFELEKNVFGRSDPVLEHWKREAERQLRAASALRKRFADSEARASSLESRLKNCWKPPWW